MPRMHKQPLPSLPCREGNMEQVCHRIASATSLRGEFQLDLLRISPLLASFNTQFCINYTLNLRYSNGLDTTQWWRLWAVPGGVGMGVAATLTTCLVCCWQLNLVCGEGDSSITLWPTICKSNWPQVLAVLHVRPFCHFVDIALYKRIIICIHSIYVY